MAFPVETEIAKSIKENVFLPLDVPPMMILFPGAGYLSPALAERREILANQHRHIIEIGKRSVSA